MNWWFEWIRRVVQIGESRGLIVTVSYAQGFYSGYCEFNWRAANNSRFGSGGAGSSMAVLTSPEEYTWDWWAGPSPLPPDPPYHPPPAPVPPNPWERHGRYVPRVPAMAVSDALLVLFNLGPTQ